jgi:hypothetical protein
VASIKEDRYSNSTRLHSKTLSYLFFILFCQKGSLLFQPNHAPDASAESSMDASVELYESIDVIDLGLHNEVDEDDGSLSSNKESEL